MGDFFLDMLYLIHKECIYYVLREFHIRSYLFKRHLIIYASSPSFFFKKLEILIPKEVYVYVVTARSILLATTIQLCRNMDLPFRSHFIKSISLNSWHFEFGNSP